MNIGDADGLGWMGVWVLGAVVGAAILAVVVIAAQWRVFAKAGEPGWAAIIPIFNVLIWLRIIGRPWWWLLLSFIPLVGVVIVLIMSIDMARSFGKGTAFGIGLFLLSFIFWCILGFGSARYVGPQGALGVAPIF